MHIDLKRVIKDIETLATFNATPGNGVTRLSFTKEDRQARDYIRNKMEAIGLKTWEDGYSNLFGRREGKNPKAPVIMIGSHYDSVINGGPLDGVLGVVAALEILRIFEENNIGNYYPIEMVAMNDEEGVRFGTGLSNSRAMAGLIDEKELDNFKDKDGISIREAMIQFGIIPDLKDAIRPKGSIKTFIELHIEQGPVLEAERKDIGLVETIVGLDRYEVIIKGMSGHAGTTPMDKRKDALVGASEFILAVNRIAKEIGDGTVGTVGQLSLTPNASNVIPGYVNLSLDIRSTKEDNIKAFYNRLIEESEYIKSKYHIDIQITHNLYIQPVNMSDKNIALMEKVCQKLGYTYMRMNSGAGHDAMIMAKMAPSSLIFVPSKAGLSHHPDEWTDYEDIEKGIALMLNTVLELCKYE